MEICEVMDDLIEVSVFSYEDEPWKIYFSFDIMYGIVYGDGEEETYAKRDEMKKELEAEYRRHNKPSKKFINSFGEKYNVDIFNSFFKMF